MEKDLLDYVYNKIKFEFNDVFNINEIISHGAVVIERLMDRIKFGFGGYEFES